jgi:thioredoxin 1
MASEAVMTFTDAAFDADVMKSDQPVLVDFWAEWCGPCKMLTPTIEALADDFAGRAKVGKMNIDDNREVATANQIMSIPTVLVFKGGEVVKKIVGLQPKEQYAAAIEEQL